VHRLPHGVTLARRKMSVNVALRRGLAAVVGCLLVFASRGLAQTPRVVDDAKLPRFEIASVRPGDPNVYWRSIGTPPGRFFMHDMELRSAVNVAFSGLSLGPESQIPEMVQRARFTVEARMPEGATPSDLPLMVRALLVDRFKLRYHVAASEEDGYVLALARRDGRLGPNLRASEIDCARRLAALAAKEAVAALPAGATECGIRNGRGVIDAGGIPMSTLARMLTNQSRGPVIDETGLTGTFDVDLRFSPESAGPPRVDAPSPDAASSIFAALQEQLGLKLTPRKTLVQHVVIDHIERPDPD
jgi:uncharacterized protein (TIGR03435 family)